MDKKRRTKEGRKKGLIESSTVKVCQMLIIKKAGDKQEIPKNQAPQGSKLFKHGQHHLDD